MFKTHRWNTGLVSFGLLGTIFLRPCRSCRRIAWGNSSAVLVLSISPLGCFQLSNRVIFERGSMWHGFCWPNQTPLAPLGKSRKKAERPRKGRGVLFCKFDSFLCCSCQCWLLLFGASGLFVSKWGGPPERNQASRKVVVVWVP